MEIGILVFLVLVGLGICFVESTKIGDKLFSKAYKFIDGLFEALVECFSEI